MNFVVRVWAPSSGNAFDGPEDDAAREQRRQDGVAIAGRLRAGVAVFADVSYEPWPLPSRDE